MMTWPTYEARIAFTLDDARRYLELQEIAELASKMKAVHPFWCRPGMDDTRCACGLADLKDAIERLRRGSR
jgi:hypothetical protein